MNPWQGGGSAFLKKAEEIAKDVLAAEAPRIDRDATWPEKGLRTLLSEGFGGLVVPRQYGGKGQGLLMLARVCEILSKECPSTGICFGMHCVATSVMSVNATDAQRENFLNPICEGKHITSLSLSELGTGIHFYLPQTSLTAVSPDCYSLTGSKVFVTNGAHADSYVVSAVAGDRGAPAGQFSCVVIPNNSEGLTWGKPWDGIGMRGNSSRTMTLQDVRIPRANLLGREGDQIWYIFNVITPFFLVAMAATYLGVSDSALNEARMHVMRRQHVHTGGLSGAPVIQHRFGKLWGMLDRTRRLVYGAAASFDNGDPDALISIMASKAEVADSAVEIVNESMTLTGGRGYSEGSKLSRHLRDVRAVHLMSPTTDLLRTWIGRSLLGVPLLAD
ncbi:acyl-CoA dehydrogenase domain protein [Hyphomicrobium denitrificans ATCC 51888]|uniref:Acyl-CoA dehydrogenase domain protein n=1 Tax=Hyphomicrobium denitrificans (strain ATCC 51888 / DSM 1869 / NCIMB 11706 / TK 0415) TaxID=582899 RepID=D8JTI4_HYPDA|nr:acyl-CoA dehydrogenase family protein [Hyphomicrobium denitrificans]ADJ22546.1 acyl-CoA dehydrogenase domain protein [Hyphomicrobium denitrificans ATCC 51888]